MKKIFILFVCAFMAITTSCKKDEVISNKQSTTKSSLESRPLTKDDLVVLAEILKQNGDSLVCKRTTSSLSGYTYFASTGNSSDYFPIGAYGVEITRSWSDPASVSIYPLVQSDDISYWGYTSLIKLDASNNVLSSQQNKSVNPTNIRPFSSVSITGSQKVWLLFWPKVNGTYKYWY